MELMMSIWLQQPMSVSASAVLRVSKQSKPLTTRSESSSTWRTCYSCTVEKRTDATRSPLCSFSTRTSFALLPSSSSESSLCSRAYCCTTRLSTTTLIRSLRRSRSSGYRLWTMSTLMKFWWDLLNCTSTASETCSSITRSSQEKSFTVSLRHAPWQYSLYTSFHWELRRQLVCLLVGPKQATLSFCAWWSSAILEC